MRNIILTIILQNHVGYRLILSRRGRKLSGLISDNIRQYNPPIIFCVRSLDKTHHVVQNQMTGISAYPLSNLISVARFGRQAQNKRMKSPYSILTFNEITELRIT